MFISGFVFHFCYNSGTYDVKHSVSILLQNWNIVYIRKYVFQNCYNFGT